MCWSKVGHNLNILAFHGVCPQANMSKALNPAGSQHVVAKLFEGDI